MTKVVISFRSFALIIFFSSPSSLHRLCVGCFTQTDWRKEMVWLMSPTGRKSREAAQMALLRKERTRAAVRPHVCISFFPNLPARLHHACTNAHNILTERQISSAGTFLRLHLPAPCLHHAQERKSECCPIAMQSGNTCSVIGPQLHRNRAILAVRSGLNCIVIGQYLQSHPPFLAHSAPSKMVQAGVSGKQACAHAGHIKSQRPPSHEGGRC